MARIRSIKPEFFKHEELQDLELEHPGQYIMLVYAGLWTQCDKNGVFPCKARTVKNEILPYINFDMQKTLDILEKGGFFTKHTSGGRDYGYIPKFSKYQYPGKAEKDGPAKYPPPPAEIANAEPFQGASRQESEQPDNGSGTVAEPFCDGRDNHTDPEGIQVNRFTGERKFMRFIRTAFTAN